jgi:DNA repair exonuclease SbcCD nuclease subunit
MLGKLKFISDLTHRLHGASLCGGDVFNIKNPKSEANNHGFMTRVITALREFPGGELFGSTGNHDLTADDPASVPTQPIGVLFAAKVYHDLVADPVLFTNNDESVNVLVETFPYEHGDKTLARLRATGTRPEGVQYRVGIVHAYGAPGNGGSMFGEPIIGYNELIGVDYDFLLWGHDHSRKETVEIGNITHVNLGALSRASLDSDQVDRPVVCSILSFAEGGIRFKEKEIPVAPLEISFITADKPVERVEKSDEIKEFFADMDEQVGELDAEDPRDILKSICPLEEHEVLVLINDLCEF